MTDTLLLRGLKVRTRIGVHDWEQRLDRDLVLDLEWSVDAASAAGSDALSDATDYQAVADAAAEFAASNQLKLIETFAERLAAQLRDRFAMPWLRVRADKPGAVPGAQSVAITIERGARPK